MKKQRLTGNNQQYYLTPRSISTEESWYRRLQHSVVKKWSVFYKPKSNAVHKAWFEIRFVAEAVSHRTPLPVVKVIEMYPNDYFPICPACDRSIEREYMNYCDRCGQRLSWYALPFATVCYPGRRRKTDRN